MKICSICGKEILSSSPNILFTDENKKSYVSCDICWESIYTLLNNKQSIKAVNAGKYIAECCSKIENEYVRNKLKDLLKANPYSLPEKQECTAKVLRQSTFWVTTLRSILKIFFGLIIAVGIILATTVFVNLKEEHIILGFLFFAGIILASVIIGVLVVGVQMVFLNMADDILKIKNQLSMIEKN